MTMAKRPGLSYIIIEHDMRLVAALPERVVALARALIGEPALVVMDEPSLGLSPKLIDEYFAIIAAIHARGTTILLTEQNVETAAIS
jgi:ABC-type branched-subunit amino acid transport system ATPase component